MDDWRLCVALGPLALYLLVLGAINLSRRPFLITGARDNAALGIGVSGMVLVGPIELLHPQEAVNEFGAYVWVLSLSIYALLVSVVVLLSRPRLTIYNISVEEFRPLLAEVVESLDPDYRWAGTSLILPRLNVQLHLDANQLMRNVSLSAVGDQQSFAGWRHLELAIARRLRPERVSPNVWGLSLSLASMLLIATLGVQVVHHHGAITAALKEMLRF